MIDTAVREDTSASLDAARLTDDVVEILGAYGQRREVPAGTVLPVGDEATGCIHVIRRGMIRTVREEDGVYVEVSRRGVGQLVGEMFLIEASPCPDTAR